LHVIDAPIIRRRFVYCGLAPADLTMELVDQQLSRGAIEAAASRIRAFVRRTPVLVVDGAEFSLPGIRLAFKLEFTQHSGSFKARGAFNSLLSRAIPAAGVVAA
jgi:threonine dehydratase